MSLPAPYWTDGQSVLYHGDCREIVPLLPRFDLLLTDPPYGLNCSINTAKETITGDKDTSLRDEILTRLEGMPSVVFGSPKVRRPRSVGAVLIWDKGELTGMGNLNFPWKPTHEEIYITGDGFKSGRRIGSVLSYHARPSWAKHPNSLEGLHPTEKPLALIIHLLQCSPAGTVLDPFAGSGTTGRACKDLGRACTMIEYEERYCEVIAQRMSQEVLPFSRAPEPTAATALMDL